MCLCRYLVRLDAQAPGHRWEAEGLEEEAKVTALFLSFSFIWICVGVQRFVA